MMTPRYARSTVPPAHSGFAEEFEALEADWAALDGAGFAPLGRINQFAGSVALGVPTRHPYDLGSAQGFMPSGRWGLLDMINFRLDAFVALLRLVGQETRLALARGEKAAGAPLDSEGNDRARFNGNFEFITRQCVEMLLPSACNRVERISMSLTDPDYSYVSVANDLNVLMEAIEDDIKFERFFHYKQDRARPLISMQGDWAATLSAFPSVEKEIERGLDCYGFEDNDGCVFHLMRTAEIGLRALARERRVSFKYPLEWAEWENVINQIDEKARADTAGHLTPRGPARDAARAFYTAAIAQLRAFKETRNRIMHMRSSFDDLDAQRAINQVRDFMNRLSAKIGEKTRSPIRRWP